MSQKLLTSCLAALLTASCAAPQPAPRQMQTQFDPAEHEPYRLSGSGSLKGQGFLRQRGGGTVTCAGSQVYLLPATPFFREAFAIARDTRQAPQHDAVQKYPEYRSIMRKGQCDAQGNFAFGNLPSGTYIAATTVTWTVADRRQGGLLLREVEVVGDTPATILLTDKDVFAR